MANHEKAPLSAFAIERWPDSPEKTRLTEGFDHDQNLPRFISDMPICCPVGCIVNGKCNIYHDYTCPEDECGVKGGNNLCVDSCGVKNGNNDCVDDIIGTFLSSDYGSFALSENVASDFTSVCSTMQHFYRGQCDCSV